MNGETHQESTAKQRLPPPLSESRITLYTKKPQYNATNKKKGRTSTHEMISDARIRGRFANCALARDRVSETSYGGTIPQRACNKSASSTTSKAWIRTTNCGAASQSVARMLIDSLRAVAASHLFTTATTIPSTVSPFLSTVIHAIASRTWPTPLPSVKAWRMGDCVQDYQSRNTPRLPHPLDRAQNRTPLFNNDLHHSFPPQRLLRHPHHPGLRRNKDLNLELEFHGYHERIAEITHPPRAAAVKDKTQPHPLVIPPSAPHCPPSLHSRHSPRPHPQNISRPQSSQTPLLSLAPDRIYAMVVVAVMLILRHQVAAYEFGRRRSIFESPPAGLTRQADIDIRRIVKNMGPFSIARTSGGGGDHRDDGYAESRDGGRSAEHAVVRYAEIIDTLLHIWEEKHSAKVYALSSNDNPSQPGLFERKATQRFDMPNSVDSVLPGGCDTTHAHSQTSQHHNSSGYHPHQQYQQPSHYAPQHPTHNPTPVFRLHTNHTLNLNPNIRITPLLPALHPHTASRGTYSFSARTSFPTQMPHFSFASKDTQTTPYVEIGHILEAERSDTDSFGNTLIGECEACKKFKQWKPKLAGQTVDKVTSSNSEEDEDSEDEDPLTGCCLHLILQLQSDFQNVFSIIFRLSSKS
ncbi:hypothetical protein M422DRAFT_243791 [Sphaerobolus stellatus SS14]|nr:hypothetical protein M422DRAFT_243791 [Sphaerobolus stellatus SS14]